jgi:hypothetical protein
MLKAQQVQLAMERHPDQVLVFLDVDCRVLALLDELVNIGGDVAFYVRSKFRCSGGMRFGVRSGTRVLQPTLAAARFVDEWVKLSEQAPWGEVDQTALGVAIGRSPGVPFEPLHANPVILHDSASRGVRKIRNWQRALRRIF